MSVVDDINNLIKRYISIFYYQDIAVAMRTRRYIMPIPRLPPGPLARLPNTKRLIHSTR